MGTETQSVLMFNNFKQYSSLCLCSVNEKAYTKKKQGFSTKWQYIKLQY